MSKLVPSISGIACLLWVAVWSWWLSAESANTSSQTNLVASPVIRIMDADSVYTSAIHFSFHLSDDAPVLSKDQERNIFEQLAHHLTNHPDKQLTITGRHLPHPNERNQSPHPNLGIARAHAIKNLLIEEGGDPDRIITAAQTVQTHMMIDGRLLGGVDFEFHERETPAKTAQTEEKEPAMEVDEVSNDQPENENQLTFHYDYKDFSLERKNRPSLDEIRKLVRKNPSYRIFITGFSTTDEEKAVGDLAKRRAMAVRRYLVDTGVRRRNIIVESQPGAITTAAERRVEIKISK